MMATTIRQAAFIRRREIGIMRLVGASNWTIRMPFLTEMVIVSGIGVILAVGLLIALSDRGTEPPPAPRDRRGRLRRFRLGRARA